MPSSASAGSSPERRGTTARPCALLLAPVKRRAYHLGVTTDGDADAPRIRFPLPAGRPATLSAALVARQTGFAKVAVDMLPKMATWNLATSVTNQHMALVNQQMDVARRALEPVLAAQQRTLVEAAKVVLTHKTGGLDPAAMAGVVKWSTPRPFGGLDSAGAAQAVAMLRQLSAIAAANSEVLRSAGVFAGVAVPPLAGPLFTLPRPRPAEPETTPDDANEKPAGLTALQREVIAAYVAILWTCFVVTLVLLYPEAMAVVLAGTSQVSGARRTALSALDRWPGARDDRGGSAPTPPPPPSRGPERR